jgi:hypothetical protein
VEEKNSFGDFFDLTRGAALEMTTCNSVMFAQEGKYLLAGKKED